MSGLVVLKLVQTVAQIPTKMHIAGVGDFNQDGNSDLVWRNGATGEDAIWLMNGTSLASGVYTTSVADQSWPLDIA
ncbi:MAG: FG-GAP repeat protein [Fuerstia sp.]|nr:FG-GAP repeat protein [Fuerstiella sp.]